MRLHPATQILFWCQLVTIMQFLPPARLLIAGSLVLTIAFVRSRHKFVQLLYRTRWIMFSLWLIYAYSTPGVAVFDAPLSPSIDGLQEGGLQLMRLLVSLAGLAMLLDHLHRLQLMAGLYSLFAPLSCLGLSRERLAVRLALTLHYAEVAMLRSASWQDNLRSLTTENRKHENENINMELPVYRIGLVDVSLITGMALLLWGVMG